MADDLRRPRPVTSHVLQLRLRHKYRLRHLEIWVLEAQVKKSIVRSASRWALARLGLITVSSMGPIIPTLDRLWVAANVSSAPPIADFAQQHCPEANN
jgi:hypothetical protein